MKKVYLAKKKFTFIKRIIVEGKKKIFILFLPVKYLLIDKISMKI